MLSTKLTEAPIAWNYLNGVMNIYKPAGISIRRLKQSILGNLCRDLNQMNVRPMRQRLEIESGNNTKYVVKTVDDLADHVLAVGPRYQNEDFQFNVARHLAMETSGVLLIGLNDGSKLINKIRDNQLLRVYHIKGRLGTATETHFKDSLITARATYDHVWPDRLRALLSSMQASHQKKMFDMCCVDIQSQTAYELATRGLIRPANNNLPLVYGIQCIHFKRPEFVIEVHALNEHESYFYELIHEIGIQLRSVAHCTGVQCVRYGNFYAETSLVRNQWTLQNILANIAESQKLFEKHPKMLWRNDANVEV